MREKWRKCGIGLFDYGINCERIKKKFLRRRNKKLNLFLTKIFLRIEVVILFLRNFYRTRDSLLIEEFSQFCSSITFIFHDFKTSEYVIKVSRSIESFTSFNMTGLQHASIEQQVPCTDSLFVPWLTPKLSDCSASCEDCEINSRADSQSFEVEVIQLARFHYF